VADLPGFGPSQLPPEDPQSPPADQGPSSAPEPDEPRDAPSKELKTQRGSSRASTAEERAAIVGAVAAVFGVFTMFLHRRLAPKQTSVWLATEKETEAIAEPLANIAGRRNPMGEATSDVADGLQAGVALAGYAIRNIQDAAYWASPEGQQRLAGGPVDKLADDTGLPVT
jgi:hypothetical protein